jgi:hypothetical protein
MQGRSGVTPSLQSSRLVICCNEWRVNISKKEVHTECTEATIAGIVLSAAVLIAIYYKYKQIDPIITMCLLFEYRSLPAAYNYHSDQKSPHHVCMQFAGRVFLTVMMYMTMIFAVDSHF